MKHQSSTSTEHTEKPRYPAWCSSYDTLLMGCKKLIGQPLKNHHGQPIGSLLSIMLDLQTGKISYAVLAYPASPLESPRLFAIPWHALVLDPDQQGFSIDVEQYELQKQRGFDPDAWPEEADAAWQRKIDGFYSSN